MTKLSGRWTFGVVLAALIGLGITLAALWGSGLEPLPLESQLWTVVSLAVLFGALGGLAFDIAEPLRRQKGWNPESFENRTGLPHFTNEARTIIDWGLLGPALVGVVASLVSVFLLGVDRPQPLPLTSGTQAEIVSSSTPTTPYVNPDSLIVLALVSGFAGPIALRAARSRLSDALKAANIATVGSQQVNEVAAAAEEKAQAQPAAVGKAVKEKTRELIEQGNLPKEPDKAAELLAGVATSAAQQVAQEQTREIGETRKQAIKLLTDTSGLGPP